METHARTQILYATLRKYEILCRAPNSSLLLQAQTPRYYSFCYGKLGYRLLETHIGLCEFGFTARKRVEDSSSLTEIALF
jgi:UDP-galactopyranose mutase